jgi:hypothetical protein
VLRAQGAAEGLLDALPALGLDVSDEVRARIEACEDLDLLMVWLRRALKATCAEDIFEDSVD